jgi:hypothetical protein
VRWWAEDGKPKVGCGGGGVVAEGGGGGGGGARASGMRVCEYVCL